MLKIAEVASRFENVRGFIGALSGLGFKITSKVRLHLEVHNLNSMHTYTFTHRNYIIA